MSLTEKKYLCVSVRFQRKPDPLLSPTTLKKYRTWAAPRGVHINPTRGRWHSFSPDSCPRSSAASCPCLHRSRWSLWAGGQPASRLPAVQSSRLWSAWCCTPSKSPPCPPPRKGPGCWRWWSSCACAAARWSTSSWSRAAAGTRCLIGQKSYAVILPANCSRLGFTVQTCDVDVLRLVLWGEVKARRRKLVLNKTKPWREEIKEWRKNCFSSPECGFIQWILQTEQETALNTWLIPQVPKTHEPSGAVHLLFIGIQHQFPTIPDFKFLTSFHVQWVKSVKSKRFLL